MSTSNHSRRLLLIATIVTGGLALAASTARAQLTETELDRGPTSELYIRKRPPIPEAPVLSKELQELLNATVKKADAKRLEAIGLLREFIKTNPTGEAAAEGLFKLAELLWEEARRLYIVAIDKYERKLEKCRQQKGGCDKQPKEPRIELGESEDLYKQLLSEHPDFRRTDLVLYLTGFAAKEGLREDEAMGYFQQVIEKFPGSPLYPDSWMMVGEHHFTAGDWDLARIAYANILTNKEAATYDLALFKTAWCDWKLGDVDLAARRFKEVLDLAVEAERSGTAAERRKRAQLREEALEYLVVVFTEDRSISAKEVYDFLASIGGERYSRDVLVKVAEAYYGQSEYDRTADTYKFLIGLDPASIKAAKYQRSIVDAWISAVDEPAKAMAEIKILVDNYGPDSAWAKANKSRKQALDRSLAQTEQQVRTAAKNFHAEAQTVEKNERTRRKLKPDAPMALDKKNLELFERAANVYSYYLSIYSADPNAAELRTYRADILYFKLARYEEAGDEFLAIGKSAPVGKFHKEALLKAMAAFEKARPKDIEAGKQRLPVDLKFGEAIDLYATLFPAGEELVDVIYRNGKMWFDYKVYDEAIKRFGVIVTKYPDNENAGPAGDRILEALLNGEDYENVEEWARRLKKAKSFSDPTQQARLDRLIVDSISKSGDKYKEAGRYEQAAGFYLRVAKEFPDHKDAPQAMTNGAIMLEKAKQPESAASVYLDLASRYPKAPQAEAAVFVAGQVYESVAYYDRAAEAYEAVVRDFPKSKNVAVALFTAGQLRQALGEHEKAIEHYSAYAKRYSKDKDRDQEAAEVAFRIGEVYEDADDDGRADQAFRAYLNSYGRNSPRAVEANVRAGRTSLRLGHTKRANESFEAALKLWKKMKGAEQKANRAWAAEARYHQGELPFREYEEVSLAVKPSKLDKQLEKKTALLDKAQSVYSDVVNFEDFKWATAALFRVAQIYDGFAEALREAPAPAEFSEEDKQLYREALENYVIEVEEKAITLASAGYQRAISMQVYNQYTKQLRETLGRQAADLYPPERESRAGERSGDRALVVEPVDEVIRDQ